MPEHPTIPALVDSLAQSPTYRAARGKQHPLLALLLLIGVALRCGARAQSASADWGRHHGRGWLRRLGCTARQAPSQPTRSRLFRPIPHRTVEAARGRWAEQARRRCSPAALEGVARDGKTRRGSRRQGAADAHLRSACSHRAGVVLGQTGVADKTTAIGAAQDFLLALMRAGRVVTAAALLTQRDLARTILAGGGDDLLVVKEHQPTRPEEVVAAFAPEVAGLGAVGRAGTVTQHGDRVASRQLTTATVLAAYRAWPGARHALRLERHTLHTRTGHLLRAATADAVTSVGPGRATPAQLLARWRGHWSVEHQRHAIRDGAFDEDRAPVRAGHAPQAMAAFRNAASGLIRRLGTTQITAACRRFMAQPHAALHALGIHPDLEKTLGFQSRHLDNGSRTQ